MHTKLKKTWVIYMRIYENGSLYCRYNTIHQEEEKIVSYKLKITTYDILLASDFISAAVCTKLFQ